MKFMKFIMMEKLFSFIELPTGQCFAFLQDEQNQRLSVSGTMYMVSPSFTVNLGETFCCNILPFDGFYF